MFEMRLIMKYEMDEKIRVIINWKGIMIIVCVMMKVSVLYVFCEDLWMYIWCLVRKMGSVLLELKMRVMRVKLKKFVCCRIFL